jgi:hypothetical protein
LDGKSACYLTITDEKTGSWLSALTFGYGRISQVPVEEVRQRLIKYFIRWGKPGAMRVDNGDPLGHSTKLMTPPLALWLIAMDIDMIWNKPHCPQQNGVVENMQATSSRWVELDKIKDLDHLQVRLDQESFLQREKLPVKRLERKTRIQVFPELETSRRIYRTSDFDEQRVYNFLSKKVYTRKVSSVGTISHYGHVFSVGTKFKQQFVQLKFDNQSIEWVIYDSKMEIKRKKAHHLAKEAILNLTVCQRTTKT